MSDPTQAAARWFCRVKGKEHGPFTDKQLRKLAHSRQLSPNDHIRKGVDGNWVSAGKVKGLFPAATPNAAASKPAPDQTSQPKPVASKSEPVPVQPASPVAAAETKSEETPAAVSADPLAAALDDLTAAPVNTRSQVPVLQAAPVQPPARPSAASEPAAKAATPSKPAANSSKKWMLIGATGGGIALLLLVGTVGMMLLGGGASDVAEATTPSEPTVAEPTATVATESPAGANDPQSATTDDPDAEQPNSSPGGGLYGAIANQSANGNPPDNPAEPATEGPQPPSPSEPTSSEPAASEPATGLDELTSEPAPTLPDESPAPSLTTEPTESTTPAESASPTEPAADPPVVAQSPKPEMTDESPAVVASESPPIQPTDNSSPTPNQTPAISTAEVQQRQSEEDAEATKLAAETDEMVRQRVAQLAERKQLFPQLTANQKKYEQVLATLKRANEELPKMQRQLQVLKNSWEEADFRSRDPENDARLQYQKIKIELAQQARKLEQQIIVLTEQGKEAVKAKTGLETELTEQTRQMEDLKQRAEATHDDLLARLDPFGLRPERHSAALLDVSSNWDPECVEAALLRGYAQLRLKKYDPATDEFTAVIQQLRYAFQDKRGPRDTPERKILQVAFAGRGLARFRSGDEREAFKDLGQGVAVGTHYTFPAVIRGLAEYERNRHDAALRDFDSAHRRDDADGSRESARLLLISETKGNPKRALPLAQEAVQRDTNWSSLEVHALALAANDQVEQARDAYRQAIELAPSEQLERLTAESAKLAE